MYLNIPKMNQKLSQHVKLAISSRNPGTNNRCIISIFISGGFKPNLVSLPPTRKKNRKRDLKRKMFGMLVVSLNVDGRQEAVQILVRRKWRMRELLEVGVRPPSAMWVLLLLLGGSPDPSWARGHLPSTNFKVSVTGKY